MRCLFTVHERKSKVYLFISTAPALTGNRSKAGTRRAPARVWVLPFSLALLFEVDEVR